MYKKSPNWGIFIIYKKTPSLPAVFPNAPKGRKGEKEMGILNLFWGSRSRGERM